MSDEHHGSPLDGEPLTSRPGANGAGAVGWELDRLPPPAFPPGSHARRASRATESSHAEAEASANDEARSVTDDGDPSVADLVLRIGRLADALRDRGEAALETTPDMSRFEATLRSYCVGYLTGRRESQPE